MTLEQAKGVLHVVYERYALASLRMDRIRGTLHGVEAKKTPESLLECVGMIEHLADKTVLLEADIADATPERLAERVTLAMKSLGLINS